MVSPANSDESMRYQMLGRDTDTIEDKLRKYSGEIGWDYLKPHFTEGNLLYVDPSLDLIQVGKAFADDDRSQVAAWMKSGDLVKPSEPHGVYWESSGTRFRAVVVSPFVLIQPIT